MATCENYLLNHELDTVSECLLICEGEHSNKTIKWDLRMTAACLYKTVGNVESKAPSFNAVLEGYNSFVTNCWYNLRSSL